MIIKGANPVEVRQLFFVLEPLFEVMATSEPFGSSDESSGF